MDQTAGDFPINLGDIVVTADDETLGTVLARKGSHLLVEKGFVFPEDFYVPMSAVSEYNPEDAKIHLNMTRDEVLSSGWNREIPDEGLM
jgi:hypothetical protein